MLPRIYTILITAISASIIPALGEKIPSSLVGKISQEEWASISRMGQGGFPSSLSQSADGKISGYNASQAWHLTFDGGSFVARPNGDNWTWGLALKRYGTDSQLVAALASTSQRVEGNWVYSVRGQALTEWFKNAENGVEHGFFVSKRPVENSGKLLLDFDVVGDFQPVLGPDGISFRDSLGVSKVNYSGLKAWDARNKPLEARFLVLPSGIRMEIDDREAQYPITIDPLAQEAYIKAPNSDLGDNFGTSVAISGNTLVVGAKNEDSDGIGGQLNNAVSNAGAAYVYVKNGGSWTFQAYLKASNAGDEDKFGASVAIDGDTIVVGAPDEGSNSASDPANNGVPGAGAVYIFLRTGTTWAQQAYLKATNIEADNFGFSVGISGDSVVAGSPGDDGPTNAQTDSGAAYVFVRSGTVWSNQGYLRASNADPYDSFGFSVGISGDSIVAGAFTEYGNGANPNDNSKPFAGAAYAFLRTGTNWAEEAYLKASDARTNAFFGISCAISGNTIVVGANTMGISPFEESGAAYVFVRTTPQWPQQAKLLATNQGQTDTFGSSVAIDGDKILVGAPNEDSSATGVFSNSNGQGNGSTNSGAAYSFLRSGASWTENGYLKASNTGLGDKFGSAVAVSGDQFISGAPFEQSGGDDVGGGGNQGDNSVDGAGAVYVFFNSGGSGLTPLETWRQSNFGITTNTGNAANTADPDNDGFPNLVEYGLTTNPNLHGEGSVFLLGKQDYSGQQYLRTIFSRDPAHNDVTIRVQGADSPAGPWVDLATSVNGGLTTPSPAVVSDIVDGALRKVEVRDTTAVSAANRRFLRIIVQ